MALTPKRLKGFMTSGQRNNVHVTGNGPRTIMSPTAMDATRICGVQ